MTISNILWSEAKFNSFFCELFLIIMRLADSDFCNGLDLVKRGGNTADRKERTIFL
jgi:hypothetical protein